MRAFAFCYDIGGGVAWVCKACYDGLPTDTGGVEPGPVIQSDCRRSLPEPGASCEGCGAGLGVPKMDPPLVGPALRRYVMALVELELQTRADGPAITPLVAQAATRASACESALGDALRPFLDRLEALEGAVLTATRPARRAGEPKPIVPIGVPHALQVLEGLIELAHANAPVAAVNAERALGILRAALKRGGQ